MTTNNTACGQFSLMSQPAGGRAVYGEADCVAGLHCIENNWPDMRPKSLRQTLAAGRAIDN